MKRKFSEEDENTFPLIADIESVELGEDINFTNPLPILPLRNMVLFPGVILPVNIGRRSSLNLIKQATKKNLPIGVFCQKESQIEDPAFEDMHAIGTIGKVVRVLEMPDQTITAIIHGVKRAELKSMKNNNTYYIGEAYAKEEIKPDNGDEEFSVLIDSCKENLLRYLKLTDNSGEMNFAVQSISNALTFVNFVCSNFPFQKNEKIMLLSKGSFKERAMLLLNLLIREIKIAEIRVSIISKTKADIDQQQREYFLQQQIKTIQDELGEDSHDQEISELEEKAEKKKWNAETREAFEKELAKLERYNPQSPDYSIQYNYLQTLLNLPWNEYTEDNLNLKNAEKTLNKDHYGLTKVKERILEHLAVLQLKNELKAPIICLYGPPGVGKTSLGRSIAAALKRKYVRMSLGGVHDESEIRGHRKTYIGAMPGRIIKGLIKAGSANPVFILDEIDKVSSDRQGDPSSALLEVLDPEQNNAFHDNYIDMDFDLSKVMFIATANNLNTIPAPLLDRMELIEVNGYVTEEKIEIARRHLWPKELEATGLKEFNIKISKPAIEKVIESYTRESGVRELEQKLGKILRKLALIYARDYMIDRQIIKPEDIARYLGKEEVIKDRYQGNEYAGVVTGLAWTAVGGEILFVETSLSKGKGGKLTLTGNLGDVMKESAMLALEYIHAHADQLGIAQDIFDNWNIHIHVPEGAIPKDGPSAGITMATSIASSMLQRKVRRDLAMTGEITLRGKVLPVGGIKEKILAAKRAGITDIILSRENERDILDIEPLYVSGLNFHYVENIKEVLDLALTDEKVKDAIDFSK
jgi:ATP-dependent Lon protease